MSESLHDMDDLFKKALKDHADTPSESVWENVDHNLDRKSFVSILKKYNKLKWVAALLLLCASAMAVYTWHVRMENRQLVAANNRMNSVNGQHSGASLPAVPDSFHTARASGKGHKDINTENQHGESPKDSLPLGLPPVASAQPAARQHPAAKGPYPSRDRSMAAIRKTSGQQNPDHQEIQPDQADRNRSGGQPGRLAKQPANTETTPAEPIAGTQRQPQTPVQAGRGTPSTGRVSSIPGSSFARPLADATTPVTGMGYLHPVTPEEPGGEILAAGRQTGGSHASWQGGNPGRFSLKAFYEPDISFKSLSSNNPMYRDEDRDEIKNQEWVKYAFTTGLQLDYRLNSRWQIGTGISYSTVTTEIQPKTIYARPDNNGNVSYRMNCSAGYSYIDLDANGGSSPRAGDSIQSLLSDNRLAYVNIPLNIAYTIGKKRWHIIPAAGLSLSFLTRGQIQTTVTTNTGAKNAGVVTVQGLKQHYLNATLSVTGQYDLTGNLGLSFGPASRFGLEPINRDVSVNTVLNSLGFAAGLVLKL